MRTRDLRRHVTLLLAASLTAGCGQSSGSRSSGFVSAASTATPAATSSASAGSAVTPTPITVGTVTTPPITNGTATPPVAGTVRPSLPAAPVVPPIAPPKPTTTTPPTTQPSTASIPGGYKRLVLCLDGLSYRIMNELQAQGYFRDFHPASRMISAFPSLSNVGWAGLLDLGPEGGYQSVYFSNQLNKGVGITKDEMTGTRYERRMHHRIEGLVSHGLSYVAPFLAGRAHLRDLVRQTLDHKGSETAFAYSLETDSVSHMRGRDYLIDLLKDLDNELDDLKTKYRARWGRDLEVVMVSDHGHTLTKGQIVGIEKWLEAGGYKSASEIKGPKDVAFKLAGILSCIAIHCQPAAAPDVARLVARMDGADLCTAKDGAGFRIVSTAGEATFVHDAARDAYAYAPGTGDPIGYKAVFAALAQQGKVDAQGFALQKDLFAATIALDYPNALERIRHGLTDLVRSPAQVVVSLKPGYESGMGFVKIAASIVGRNGTHGALHANDSTGIFMTNFQATPAAITPADFQKHVDLKDYKANPPSIESNIEPRFDTKGNVIGGEMRLLVRDDGYEVAKNKGQTTTVKAVIKRNRFLLSDKPVAPEVTANAATLGKDGPAHVLVITGVVEKLEEGKAYRVEIVLERKDKNGTRTYKEERELEFKFSGTYQQSAD